MRTTTKVIALGVAASLAIAQAAPANAAPAPAPAPAAVPIQAQPAPASDAGQIIATIIGVLTILGALAKFAGSSGSGDEGALGNYTPATNGSPSTTNTSKPRVLNRAKLEHEIYLETNRMHASHGLSLLEWLEGARPDLRVWTDWLVAHNEFRHPENDAERNYKQFSENLIPFLNDGDEKQVAAKAVDGWMHSPGHRANILNPDYTWMATGVTFGPEGKGNIAGQRFGGDLFRSHYEEEPEYSAEELEHYAGMIVDAINKRRKAAGLSELAWYRDEQDKAQNHANSYPPGVKFKFAPEVGKHESYKVVPRYNFTGNSIREIENGKWDSDILHAGDTKIGVGIGSTDEVVWRFIYVTMYE